MTSNDPCAPRIAWGTWDERGRWHPNLELTMSREEQYRQNVANGYFCLCDLTRYEPAPYVDSAGATDLEKSTSRG